MVVFSFMIMGPARSCGPGPVFSPRRKLYLFSALILIVIAAIYSLLSILTPLQLDDLQFSVVYLSHNNAENSFSFETLMKYAEELRNNDNSRLGNILFPLLCVIRPCASLFPYIIGIAMACIVAFASSLICNRPPLRNPLAIIAIWTAFIFFLPWRNNIITADYSINYILSAALSLIFIYLFIRWKHSINTAKFLILLLLAIVAAPFHEGFAFPLFCGLTFYGLFLIRTGSSSKYSIRAWIILAIFLLFALGAFLSPGMFARINNGSENINPPLTLFFDYFISYTLCLLLLLLLLFSRGRVIIYKASQNPFFIVALISALCGMTLSLITPHTPRMAWWPDICSLICWGILFRSICGLLISNKIFKSLVAIVVSIFLFSTAILQSAAAIYWQYRLSKESTEIFNLISKSETGTAFYDITMPEEIPAYTLFMPARAQWVTPYSFNTLNDYLHTANPNLPDDFYPAVVPSNGNAWLLHADSLDDKFGKACDVFVETIENEKKSLLKGMALPFISPSGQRLIYLKIYNINPVDHPDLYILSVTRAEDMCR